VLTRGAPERRGRGRPQVRPDDETLRMIVDAAREAFLSQSFGEVAMAAIARRAGVSTKTMYRLVPTKADLFRNLIADRISRFMVALDLDSLDHLAPLEALTRLLTSYGEMTLGEEAVAMYRLAITEADRFPEIASYLYEGAIGPAAGALDAWLYRQCGRGNLRLADPRMASGLLRGMLVMEPQRGTLLRQRPLPDTAQIASRARACAELFLSGCWVG
jgi:AcrR family transcriptional regulator